MFANRQPLTGASPAEVLLERAPLARVIAQVRFPTILAIHAPERVASFQDAVRSSYPILDEVRAHHIVVDAAGAPTMREGVIWRFNDDANPQWRVSLSADFVALETSSYRSRDDFLARLSTVLRALEDSFRPAEAQRIGLRYIDRLSGKALTDIQALVRPEVLGIIHPNDGAPSSLRKAVLQLMTEALFAADEGHIKGRWGGLPSNVTHDPEALEPIVEPSWILDLDMFTATARAYESDELVRVARTFANRLYAVFREMVTAEFLRFFGGTI